MESATLKILIVTADIKAGRAFESALRALGHHAVIVPPSFIDPSELAAFHATLVDVGADPEVRELLVQNVAYVVFTGDRDAPEQILQALRAGAADFVPRECLPAEIENVLQRLLLRVDTSTPAIEVEDRPGHIRRVRLEQKLTVGRDPSNDLSLDTAVVSRFHARIFRRGTEYWIADCASRHGTFVNDLRVEGDLCLRNGARIRMGDPGAPVLYFRRSQETPADAPTAPSSGLVAPDASVDSSQELRDIASLVDTFLKLNGDLVLEDVLQIVVARSVELADADRGVILLAEGAGTPGNGATPADEDSIAFDPRAIAPEPGLRLAMARARDGTALDVNSVIISQKIPGEVLKTGVGVIFADLLDAESVGDHPGTIQLGVRSAMCVPLRIRRSKADQGVPPVLGVLYVDSAARQRPFSQRLLHALESLASEAAQAIHNSQLYEECLVKRELDAEMRMARRIQKNLLPPTSFKCSWVELHGSSQASREVGGDLLDYHVLGEERVHLLLGDVSGKGIPAAMLSSLLDGLFHGLCSRQGEEPDLARATADLNYFLMTKSGEQKFASAIFGILGQQGVLRYVNAGHNPPLLVRKGGKIEVLREHGMILGMLEEATYKTVEVHLLPSDVLILYSDGITEARARNGERFGLERLLETAQESRGRSAREIHDAVLDASARFVAGAPRSDDATIMVVKRLD